MDIRSLKLALIKAISQCEDPELLSTLAAVLKIEKTRSSQSAQTHRPPWESNDSSDTTDLQQSIDDIFHP